MAIAQLNLLNLLVLRCRDIGLARAFYETVGFSFLQEQHGKGPVHYSCEDAQGVLELYPAKGEPDQAGLGFGTDDLESVFERLKVAGYEPKDIGDGPYGLSFVVRDPDGRRVELKARG